MTDDEDDALDPAEPDDEDIAPPPEFDPRTVPVRWSWLSRFSLSAAHARHAANRGNSDEGTLAMKLGTGVHALAFDQPFSVFGPGVFEGKPHKGRRGTKAWKAFKAEHDRTLGVAAPILTVKEHAHAAAMAHALRTDPIAAPILYGDGVEHETLIEWTRNGRKCRSRTDARLPGCWIADLKTCRTAQPSRFIRAANWAGYPGQLCFYDEADAYHTARDVTADPIPLYIVAIESAPPYVVVVYQLDEFAIDAGRRTVADYWAALNRAEGDGAWHGYSQSVCRFTADDPKEAFDPAVPQERPEAA